MDGKFFVYKDNQILGPFAPEEMGQALVGPETLVCEESLSGRRDADWRALREVPELSQVRVLEPAFFDEAPPGSATGALERLELESLGLPRDDDGQEWIQSLFEDADFRRRFGILLPKGEDKTQELSFASGRIAELSGEVEALRARIEEYEKLQHAQWRKVDLPKILETAVELPPLDPKIVELPRPAQPPPDSPAPVKEPSWTLPPVAAMPPFEPPKREAVSPPVPALAPALEQPPKAEPAAPAPKPGLKLKIAGVSRLRVADEPASEPRQTQASPAPASDLPQGRTFDLELPSASSAPAEASLAPAAEEIPLPPAARPLELKMPEAPLAPPAPLGQAPQSLAPATSPISLEPAPISLEPPEGAPPQSGESTPSSEPAPAATTLQPVPIPSPATPAPIPLTAVFGSGEAPLTDGGAIPVFSSAPVDLGAQAGDLAAAASPAATPGLADAGAAADVVARLARPQTSAPTAVKPPRRVNRMVVTLLLVLTVVAAAVFFLFFRNPKDLTTMVSMGSDQKPLGAEVPEQTEPKPFAAPPAAAPPAAVSPAPQASPAPVASQAPTAPAPAPQPPAFPAQPQASPAPVASPAPPASPASAAPAADAGDAAIALVKGFPLDGSRGTVGAWLQYSFAANPGDGAKEQWTAGAVDANTYLVQYQVTGAAQPVNYVFEADLQRQIVLGRNPDARQLLAGEPAKPKKRPSKPRRKAKKKAARRKPRAAAPSRPPDLLPLPTDAELMPPAEDDASFHDPTVLQQPGE